mmetsp:Transcript_20501/g.23022  ORF Transcript_20501/g.23022 Transcript_20501/m.23022 type:complete len:357 (-) Transcript_20501:250-1320(-)
MKNSCPVILSSVVLSFFVSISSGGVQGQSFGTCITTEFIDGNNNTTPFYNSQTIYSILCLDRQDPAVDPTGYTNSNFKTLCTLLNQTTEVKNILNNTSSRLTFFAPANAAFVGVNTASFTPAQIKAVLQTHILPKPKLLKDLPCGECQCTMEGGGPCRTRTRTVCPNAGNTYQVGGGNTGPGGVQEFPEIGQPLGPTQVFLNNGGYWGPGNNNIIRTNEEGHFSEDAVACNGIIHAVDKLIMPGVNGRNPQCGTTPGGKGDKGSKSNYGGYGGKGTKGYGGYGRYGGKGQKGRQLDMEDTFFEDEDEVEGEGEEEDSSVVPPQDGAHSSTSEERSQRRKRFLESLITPNGEIEPLE